MGKERLPNQLSPLEVLTLPRHGLYPRHIRPALKRNLRMRVERPRERPFSDALRTGGWPGPKAEQPSSRAWTERCGFLVLLPTSPRTWCGASSCPPRRSSPAACTTVLSFSLPRHHAAFRAVPCSSCRSRLCLDRCRTRQSLELAAG